MALLGHGTLVLFPSIKLVLKAISMPEKTMQFEQLYSNPNQNNLILAIVRQNPRGSID